MFIILTAAVVIPAYVVGSVNGALISSRMLYRKDIRDYGSGNAGLTNFYRVFGKSGIILVLLIDILKTALPVIYGGWLLNRFYGSDIMLGQLIAGLSVIFGHCYPLFYKFKGGKGVMAIGIIIIIFNWKLALIAWGVFILITAVTRFVSLGSILGSTSVPVMMIIWNIGGIPELVIMVFCVLLIIFRHSENIKRVFRGEESKFSLKRNSKDKVE